MDTDIFPFAINPAYRLGRKIRRTISATFIQTFFQIIASLLPWKQNRWSPHEEARLGGGGLPRLRRTGLVVVVAVIRSPPRWWGRCREPPIWPAAPSLRSTGSLRLALPWPCTSPGRPGAA